ncbi:MAG TPA: universal stress protein [Streptosporangiaceae bacterium]
MQIGAGAAEQTAVGAFRRALVAWDGSPDSVAALRAASAIVGGRNGHVVALSVLPVDSPREASNDPAAEAPSQARRVRATFDATRSAIAKTSSVRIDLHTAESRHVAGSICDYAAEHGFDLLVIGRHGEGGLIHPKLGHIAESAARSCKIPVLLVSA